MVVSGAPWRTVELNQELIIRCEENQRYNIMLPPNEITAGVGFVVHGWMVPNMVTHRC